MLHKQYGDEGDEGHDNDEEEEEKVLPEFKVGDRYGLFFSGSKKVTCILVTTYLTSLSKDPSPYIPFARYPVRKGH